jgi:putative molybdopterin biosynthesis protein
MASSRLPPGERKMVRVTLKVQNNVAELRQKRGLSAAELAAEIGVSRQAIYSMEAGTYVPNTTVTLKLSRVFGVTVEEIFQIEEDDTPPAHLALNVKILPGEPEIQPGQPVQLCRVGKRLVAACPQTAAWSLPLADGVLVDGGSSAKQKDKTTVQLFGEEKDLAKRVMVAGCDPGISVLSRHVRRAGIELVVINRNSSQSLDLLKQGLVHVAGTHLQDKAAGESNLPAVRQRFAKGAVAVIGFAIWEVGIVVARGDPKGIRTISDFARKDITIVNRESGAGCRLMLDYHLAQLGITAKSVRGYGQIALGHLPAAWHVLTGKADCCIATKAAARVFGLDFISMLTERYDLVIRTPNLNSQAVQVLLDTLGRSAFRRELEGSEGYDTRTAGYRLA